MHGDDGAHVQPVCQGRCLPAIQRIGASHWQHHRVQRPQLPDLFLRQVVAQVAQVGQAEAPVFQDMNGVPPPQSAHPAVVPDLHGADGKGAGHLVQQHGRPLPAVVGVVMAAQHPVG